MTLRYTNLDDIEERHLHELVTLGVPEIRHVEYKRELPGGGAEEGKEFLADVCSFANAGGGDLVYGVEEQSGVPVAVPGVPISDPDAEVLRLEGMILSGLDPRLVGFGSRPVPLANGHHALVLRVPRSFARPHAVNYKNRFRYYSRNSAGKYPMDATEVRNAVLASESVAEKLRFFRANRLEKIAGGEGAAHLGLPGRAAVVLHLLPLSAFDVPEPQVDLELANREYWPLLDPVGGLKGDRPRYNFDGLLRVTTLPGTPGPLAYAQLFRNGAVETASSDVIKENTIASIAFERYVLNAVSQYLDLQERLEVATPVFAMLSLLGVRGYRLTSAGPYDPDEMVSIDRDDLVFPEVVFDEFNHDWQAVATRMRSVFDAIWNACGLPRSPNYDYSGRWGERLW